MGVIILFYLMIGVGVLTLFAALSNWEWFFKQRRAKNIVKLVGRNGARVIYALLGTLFAVIGWMVLSGRMVIDSFS